MKMTKIYGAGPETKEATPPGYDPTPAGARRRLESDLINDEIERRQQAEKAERRRDDLDYRLNRQFGELKHIDVFESRRKNEELAYRFFNFAVTLMTPRDWEIHAKAVRFCRENGIKALSEDTNPTGGALVPAEFDRMIVRLIEQFGVFRKYARQRLMTSDIKTQARRTGGLTANWIVEGGAITASEPTYDNLNLVAKKLATLTAVTSEINDDAAISIADEIAAEVAQAYAESEDQAGFNGDGSPTFGNITGVCPKLKGLSATIANIAGLKVAAGNTFAEFLLQDFIDVAGLLPAFADQFAGWFCHRSFYFGTMLRVALVGATNLAVGGVVSMGADGRPMFLGYPVNFTQVMPKADANSQIACLFGDLALAAILGDRRNRTLFADPYSLATSDQIRFRAIERVDINFHSPGNATAVAADKAPGPIVGLISAAA